MNPVRARRTTAARDPPHELSGGVELSYLGCVVGSEVRDAREQTGIEGLRVLGLHAHEVRHQGGYGGSPGVGLRRDQVLTSQGCAAKRA